MTILELATIVKVTGLPQSFGGKMIDEHELIAQTMCNDAERRGRTDLSGAHNDDFVTVHSDHSALLCKP